MPTFRAISELCNVVSMVVYCSQDRTMLLMLESATAEYWIPSLKVPEGESWQSQLNKDMKEIFDTTYNSSKLLCIYKVWLPDQATNLIYHCVYGVIVNNEEKKNTRNAKGRYRGKLRWMTEAELLKLWTGGNLRSPEIHRYFSTMRDHCDRGISTADVVTQAQEYIQRGKLVEISLEVLVGGGNTIHEQLVSAAGFTMDLQKYIYREFVYYCFPAMYMGVQAFTRFFIELGWTREDVPFIFKAADISGRNGLSYRDFLYILGAVDPNTSHGGGPAELRCRYIFRFFDRDKDGILNLAEFRTFISFMRKAKSLPNDLMEAMKDSDVIYKSLGFSATAPLTIVAFLQAVGSLKIRGTSHTFRSAKSLQQYMQNILKREVKYQHANVQNEKAHAGTTSDFGFKSKSDTKGYELALHSVTLQKSATLINVDELWNLEGALSQTALNIVSTSAPAMMRKISIAVFNQESLCNELLKSLRYLHHLNKGKAYTKGKSLFSWGNLDREMFARQLIRVCDDLQTVLKKEPRLLDLRSPMYIMGDLHGNIFDLIYFEKVFWHLGPCLCPCNLLFLGDYVDRGAYGVEVVTYLFCYKIQAPKKVWLLRGNHEIRDIQRMFSFLSECTNKFGEETGNAVWEAVNKVFDCMPLACVLDGKVFCCHGGIPPPWLCPILSAINQIPVPLSQPDQECPLAWEIMWNDPVRKTETNDSVIAELNANEGFAMNERRGTAHVFNVEALEHFLEANNFSHIIRAHEVVQAGVNIQQKAKLVTVFSSSKYCGGQNEAACILADQGKLRILRIETT